MHGLTKILVLLAAVLSIFLSAMVIAYAANTDRIQSDYAAERSLRYAAEASLASQAGMWAQEQNRLQQEITRWQNQVAGRDAEISTLRNERSNLITEVNRASTARDSVESKIKELVDQVRTQTEINKAYSEEVKTLRSNELTYRGRMLEMENRVSDLESQRDVLTQNYRAVQEQLAEAKLAASGASPAAGAVSGQPSQPFEFAGPEIRGRIESLTRDAGTNKQLARVNVGSNNQVSKNMKFYIVRDGTFIGNLVIRQADLQFSVGEVALLAAGAEPRDGDEIRSRLR